ncbi:T9SS type A sorting domain-containing protein [candidate division TA06 bacterium]|uniref:carboxypeptidase T n=1 Tax=candidate division TA06 bacterium TaxID=2250710 RepID=A0A933I6T3_UNCT6|nr:T9SS type A sorting domain-containing protein [candidate division TA06 bacterium]
MKRIILSILSVVFFSIQADAIKQLVLMKYSDKAGLEKILSNSNLDVLKIKNNYGVECLADDSEVSSLKSQGFSIDVIIADVIAYNRKIKANYKSDTFGPYYSYAEAVAEMNQLHAQYPSLVSAPESLGAGWEHRPVWAFKVSSSPTSDNGKPGVLYTGVHHAREPIGVTINLGFARYLCQNYNSDPGIKTLLDNRQIWFVPIVNPDGYVFNQTYPDSMWRKNRRNNGDGTYGVDPNRNYPYRWGYDDVGSSPTPSSETYRGPSAGSEPEIQAVMALMSREGYFKTALNYHSYSNMWIYPWGYVSENVPDSLVYRDLAKEVASYNGYSYGTSWELLYNTNGDADDYMYKEEPDKPKCFAFTPEVGEWFWQADTSIIVQQFNDNLMPNILTAQAAGLYLAATGQTSISGGDGDTIAEPGEMVNMLVQLKNRAMDQTAISVTAVIKSDDPYINIKQAAAGYGDFLSRQNKNNVSAPYQLDIDPGCPLGHPALFKTGITCNTGEMFSDSFKLTIGQLARFDTVFADSVENGEGAWTHSGGGDLWHITTYSSHTPSHSWYCGNEGSWQYNDDMNCRLASGPISSERFKALEFWTRYGLETDYDYGYVEISTDGGATWKKLDSSFNGTAGWTKKVIDLSGYSGTIKLGFRLFSDMYVTDEGWYLDDILVTGDTSSNQPPGSPAPISPAGGVVVLDPLPYLTVSNSGDPNGDVLSYGFSVYSDSLLTNIYAQGKNVVSGSGTTAWQLNKALVPGHYWWRAYADDGKERGLFCDKADFVYQPTGVQDKPELPAIPKIYAMGQFSPNPSNGSAVVKYQLPKAGRVNLKIYNVTGQVIKTLSNGHKTAGYYSIGWDGRDDWGQKVRSGIYFYQLQTPGYSSTKKITVIR